MKKKGPFGVKLLTPYSYPWLNRAACQRQDQSRRERCYPLKGKNFS
jgi:hypothetical protein